jgi:single stranded DNA-binding protein
MVWGRQAEVALQYLHKGNLVHIEGRLRNNEWEKDGQKHRSAAIVVDRLTLMPQGERRQGSLSTDFEREIEESARPQVEPLKPGYMKPMEPITNLPEDEGGINVADIPF